ncbi:major tail protein [Clostridium sp. Marseille-Q2269]|uniref:major tail protein n=1 Tax=Clostridium sp. Marseille-Q2269 TaxID=2942205 RepID=UPI002072DEAF|nr:major tail protein [Clostridium sp. Marseille-Q2269]
MAINRNVGLRDLYTADVTTNTKEEYTTGKPELLARAVSAKIQEKFNSQTLYSDDSPEGAIRSFEGVSIDLEVDKLLCQKIASLYGQKYENGFLVGNTQDTAKDKALGFRSKIGDTNKYEFYWFYVVGVDGGLETELETLAEKPKGAKVKIKLLGRGREKDDNYKIVVNETELMEGETDAMAAIKAWFSKVQEPVAKVA